MKNLLNYLSLFTTISLLLFFASCEQQELIQEQPSNLEAFTPSEEMSNFAASLNPEEKTLFSGFSTIKYNGMEYTAEEAENSTELRQLLENNSSFVVTRDLDAYKAYLRSNAQDIAEEPKHDVLHILDNEDEQEAFIGNRERQIDETGELYRAGCWNKFKVHLTLYAKKNYRGDKLTYFDIHKHWDKDKIVFVPYAFTKKGVESYKAKYVHLPAKDNPRYKPAVTSMYIISNNSVYAYTDVYGHKCDTHVRKRASFGLSLVNDRIDGVLLSVQRASHPLGKIEGLYNF